MANDYKCGVCGDLVGNPHPRAYEDGGKYGRGIIAAQYQAGKQCR